tara:strand:+ start:43 stop:519 length:477 start_codon:yes stop_codon:yes gene_type:complete
MKKITTLIFIITLAFFSVSCSKPTAAQLLQQGNTAIAKGQFKQAMPLYTQAAKLGNAQAQYELANLYLAGKHVKQNISKAVVLYKQSAQQGYAKAQYQLGKLMYNDQYFQHDWQQANHWVTQAAKQGDADAKALLPKVKTAWQGEVDYLKQHPQSPHA